MSEVTLPGNNDHTPRKQSKFDICLFKAATCTLCALASRSDTSKATECACFQTDSSISSSATLFCKSALCLTVALERSAMKIVKIVYANNRTSY